jgi:hypothetical protein
MKLDPGMHIGKHLVFFGKSGVTSNELQAQNQHNRESFHPIGGQILYKRRKNLTLWSKKMRSSLDGWFAWKP